MQLLRPGVETDALVPYLEVDRTSRAGRVGPWVLANMVGGLDGCAAVGGRVGMLSGGADALLFQRLRRLADVVLVGAGTVRCEGYGPVRLGAEDRAARVAEGRPPVPPIAVVSRSLSLDWDAALFREGEARTIVFTGADAPEAQRARAQSHADVVVAGTHGVDLGLALEALAQRGAGVVLSEGGPSVLGGLVAADRLDEYCLTVSPVMGGDPLPLAVIPPGTSLRRFHLASTMTDGDTLFLRYERAM